MANPPQSPDRPGARRVFAALALAILLPLAWLGTLDGPAGRYVDSGLRRALVTFATARAANGVNSVLQGTAVDIAPMGLGVTATPGQILDPLNDLVEEFSTLMLMACVSFGMQRILVSLSATWAVSAALTVFLLAWALSAWRAVAPPRLVVRVLAILLFVRFAPAVAAVGAEEAFRVAMLGTYSEAQSQLELTKESFAAVQGEVEAQPGATFLDRMKGWFARKGADIGAQLKSLEDKAEAAVRHIVTLMALFAVQTVLLPLLFLWVVYRLFNAALWSGPGWRGLAP
jgi:hypothetical protein